MPPVPPAPGTPEYTLALEAAAVAADRLAASYSAMGTRGAGASTAMEELAVRLRTNTETLDAATDQLSTYTTRLREMEDASRTLARGTERLISTLTGVEKTADGVVAGFARMIAEGDGLQGKWNALKDTVHIVGREIAETMTPTNMAIATFKKFTEASSVLTLSIDNATTAFAKSTGTGLKYRDVIQSVEFQNRDLGVTADHAATAVGALQSGFSEFLMMSEGAQKELAGTVAQFETFGVSADNTTGFLQAVTRTTNTTRGGALRLQKSIMGTAKAFGDDLNKVMQEASTIMPKLAVHGKDMEKVFDDLYSASKRTGMGMQDIISLSKQFDTFESAADAAGQLNSVLASMGGTPLVDTMEILETTNPAERMELFRNAISQSVGDFESLDYWSQEALASTLGMSSEQLLMMMNQEEQVDALEVAMSKAGLRQEEMVELQKAGRDFAMEAKILAMSFAVSLQKPLTLLKDTMASISKFMMDISRDNPWLAGLAKIGGALAIAAGMGALTTIIGFMMMRGSSPLYQTYASDTVTHGLLNALITRFGVTGPAPPTPGGPGGAASGALKAVGITLALTAAVKGIGKLQSDMEKDKAAGEEEKAASRARWGKGLAVGLGITGAILGSIVPGAGTAGGAALGIGMGTAIGGLFGVGAGAALGSEIGGSMAEGGITQGLSIAGEAGPEAVVPLPNGKTIPVTLHGAALEPLINPLIQAIDSMTPMKLHTTALEPLIQAIDSMAREPVALDPLIKKLDEVANRITNAVNKTQTTVLISDLEAAGFSRGNASALKP